MLTLSFWILLAAALGGATMAAIDGATKLMRIGHGLLAAIGLVILLIAALSGATSVLTWTAFALIAAGFSAGALLFGVIWRDSAPPRLLIAAHGLINATGVVILGFSVFG